MAQAASTGRPHQRMRTRKDLLQAASRLMSQGRKPALEEIAEEALVSRATAYRYFQSVEALMLEASLDIAMPASGDLFPDGASLDPIVRLERVDAAIDEMIRANEAPLRMMLAQSMERRVKGEGSAKFPARQNRRSPLIEAALEPVRRQIAPAALETLSRSLALVIGTEAMIVFKDVLQLSDAEARKVKRWAIRALVEAAMKPRAGR